MERLRAITIELDLTAGAEIDIVGSIGAGDPDDMAAALAELLETADPDAALFGGAFDADLILQALAADRHVLFAGVSPGDPDDLKRCVFAAQNRGLRFVIADSQGTALLAAWIAGGPEPPQSARRVHARLLEARSPSRRAADPSEGADASRA